MTYSQRAKQIFEDEIEELHKLGSSIDSNFDKAIELINACQGKVVVMGIGKTGIIGHKIASSLASTGTPAIFVNAAEAVHGDLGIINGKDVVLLVSNSGSSSEILNVIGPVRNLGCSIIAMTGDLSSRLAKEADIVVSIHVDKEACPLGLAPTTSTTATGIMGDALMICLMEKHHFKAENFAVYHPGGALGRKLLGRVKNLMTTNVPRVEVDTPFKELVHEMSDKHLGMTMVYNGNKCIGIITDGDLRRAIQKYDDLHIVARDVMTPSYKHIHKEALLSDALAVMDQYNITTLAVTERPNTEEIIGIISIHHIIDFN
ncbi:MAG: KpsF/GutQ family sugar-phosphate isomerase [Paludibacteraceae bacterium]|nr:KpsF/GutQ family sugar-phosphate isomerase [Paludibacteraceae bacterium]